MTSREKIIVAMAAAALLYGLYTIVSGPEKEEPVKGSTATAVVMAKEVLRDEPVDMQAIARVLVNAQQSWQNSAFLTVGLDAVQETVQGEPVDIEAEVKRLTYSGYLEMSGERIAIINNREYRSGEMVAGFTLEEITSSQVRLAREQKSFVLGLQELK